jgi:hypothetical protein
MKLNDSNVDGHNLVVGWGKTVKINANPFVLPLSTSTSIATAIVQHQSKLGFSDHPPIITTALTATTTTTTTTMNPSEIMPPNDTTTTATATITNPIDPTLNLMLPIHQQRAPTIHDIQLVIKEPTDLRIKKLIDMLASYVAVDGEVFEKVNNNNNYYHNNSSQK